MEKEFNRTRELKKLDQQHREEAEKKYEEEKKEHKQHEKVCTTTVMYLLPPYVIPPYVIPPPAPVLIKRSCNYNNNIYATKQRTSCLLKDFTMVFW